MNKNRYWIAKSEPAISVIEDFKNRQKVAVETLQELMDKYGFSEMTVCGGKINAIYLEKEPDLKIWKRVKGADSRSSRWYSPRCKEGKEIIKDLRRAEFVSDEEVKSKCFKNKMFLISKSEGIFIPHAFLEEIGDAFVISACDDDRWEPIEGLEELKTSEYFALKGE